MPPVSLVKEVPMIRPKIKTLTLTTTVLVALAAPALAGPPLICHAFETGSAALLPWTNNTTNWNAPDPSYDVRRLTTDTMRLLGGEAPILSRMENLRRATIYAARDASAARQLLAAVLGRALTATMGPATGSGQALAYFDAAYLVEAYRQGSYIGGQQGRDAWTLEAPPAGLDGYVLMKTAIALAGSSAEMEFAASLMSQGAVASAHRARATSAASADSLIARNLSKIGY
jgi:hypothetical protein